MVRLRRASHALLAALFVLVGAVAPVSHVCVTMDGAAHADAAAQPDAAAPAHEHAHHGGRDEQESGAPPESCDCLSHCGVASPAALAPAAAATLPQARPAHAAPDRAPVRPALVRAARLQPPATAPPLRSI